MTEYVSLDTVFAAVGQTHPELIPYLQTVLPPQPQLSVPELNRIFRYELVKCKGRTVSAREWLEDLCPQSMWLTHFTKHVLPTLARNIIPNTLPAVGIGAHT